LDAETATSALGYSSRSEEKRWEKTLRQVAIRVEGFLNYSDKFVISHTLEELSTATATKSRVHELDDRCEAIMEEQPLSRVYSGQWFDKNQVPLMFYFGYRRKDEVHFSAIL
jgi:hypothetical protein